MLLSLPLQSQQPKHLEYALLYVGETEVTPNSSPSIDKMLFHVGLNPGYPYCAAFVSFCLFVAKVKEPTVRSARAQAFITKKSIPASKVLRGEVQVPAGTIVVWKQGESAFGHVGFATESWRGASGKTIEGNTSSNNRGSQREGEGFYLKNRTIIPTAAFRITHFTLVEY